MTSVSQIEPDTSTGGSGEEGRGEGGGEREEGKEEREEEMEGEGEEGREGEGEEGREGEGEEGKEEGREYGGGRFAGVGDFEPSVERASTRKRTDLPLFKSKPEAALR